MVGKHCLAFILKFYFGTCFELYLMTHLNGLQSLAKVAGLQARVSRTMVSVNYHRNVEVSILLDQWLALTVLRATCPRLLKPVSSHHALTCNNF